MLRLSLSLFALVVLACAQSVHLDPEDLRASHPPTAQFNPAPGHIPFPHSSLLDAQTGRVLLPAPCNEPDTARGLRTQILNQLDGFGTFRFPLTTTFTHPLNMQSLSGRVLLMKLEENPTPVEVDLRSSPVQTWTPECTHLVDSFALTLTAKPPLDDNSEYVVILLKGIQTDKEIEFLPSSTWSLVRQATPPVEVHYTNETTPPFIAKNATPFDPTNAEDFEKLLTLDKLWRDHQPTLRFLDAHLDSFSREDLLLAWSFKTQTIKRVFDPHDPGSLVKRLDSIAPTLVITETVEDDPGTLAANEVVTYIQEELDTWYPRTENEPTPYTCDAGATSLPDVDFTKLVFPCESVGTIQRGYFFSPSYQHPISEGDARTPGPWLRPIDPPQAGGIQRVPFLALLPRSAPDKPSGYPVILFGHGVKRSKEQLFRFAPRLVKEGFAVIALDWAKHGERALQINHDDASGCGDKDIYSRPTYSNQHCYEAILSPILPTLRDTFRQSQLDAFQFKRSIDGCAQNPACNASFHFDPKRQGFLGHSLGVLLSVTPLSYWTDLKAVLLSVGASGWVDLILSTRGKKNYLCPLLDGLITAGLVEGETTLEAGDQASCISGAYRHQPAFWEFVATGRWILDPADGANFAPLLGARLQSPDNPTRVALLQICNDELISPLATENLGDALLLPRPSCDAATNQPSSAAISELFRTPGSHWVTYNTTPSSIFTHSTLTSNSIFKDSYLGGSDVVKKTGERGLNAVLEYQSDVAQFFKINLKNR